MSDSTNTTPAEAASTTHAVDAATVARYQFHGRDVAWLLDDRAANRGDHPFLVWEPKDGASRTWTYGEFAEATRKVAAGLSGRGVGVGDAVLIHAGNCPEAVIAWYAVARLGGISVTTNTRS
ncbi:MAG: AMP-binding protein, partial [Microthrixaceae bacterium]|nr:AMP-binding protein [Microthrixaceae bacterium]